MGLVSPLRVPSLLKPQQAKQSSLPRELKVLLTTVNREQYRLSVRLLSLGVLRLFRGFTFHEYMIYIIILYLNFVIYNRDLGKFKIYRF